MEAQTGHFEAQTRQFEAQRGYFEAPRGNFEARRGRFVSQRDILEVFEGVLNAFGCRLHIHQLTKRPKDDT